MRFQLVPTSITLNVPERRNSPSVCVRVISPNSVAFMTTIKVVEDTPVLSAAEI